MEKGRRGGGEEGLGGEYLEEGPGSGAGGGAGWSWTGQGGMGEEWRGGARKPSIIQNIIAEISY